MKKLHLKSCLEAQWAALCSKPGLKSAPGGSSSVPTRLLIPCAPQEFAWQTFWRFDPGSSWKPLSFLRWASWWSSKRVCVQEMYYSVIAPGIPLACEGLCCLSKCIGSVLTYELVWRVLPRCLQFLIISFFCKFINFFKSVATTSSCLGENETLILWADYDDTG